MLNFLIRLMPWVALTCWGILLILVLQAILRQGPDARRWWITTFSEEGGAGSLSRVLTAMLFVVMSGLIIYCVVERIAMPFTLTEAAEFAISPYAANKITNKLADAWVGKATPPPAGVGAGGGPG